MSNILFFTFNELIASNGISKKIEYQKTALEQNGNTVHLMYIKKTDSEINIFIDREKIASYHKNIFWTLKLCSFKFIVDYVIKNSIDGLYVRYTQFSSPNICKVFRNLKLQDIKIVLEIPSYPYDDEFKTFRQRVFLHWERLWRKRLANYIDYIVTFSQFDRIWNRKTIRIKNGIDFSNIPLRKMNCDIHDKMEIIAVAGLSFWHGFDRIIEGLNDYVNKNSNVDIKVHLNIVGKGEPVLGMLMELVNRYKLNKYVTFCGEKFGLELDALFESADLAIGCLGCHRKNIKEISSLKNVEYAARGVPFIYSEINRDFDDKPYIKKEQPDDSPIDIQQLIEWRKNLHIKPLDIRNSILQSLSWMKQMSFVSDKLNF